MTEAYLSGDFLFTTPPTHRRIFVCDPDSLRNIWGRENGICILRRGKKTVTAEKAEEKKAVGKKK